MTDDRKNPEGSFDFNAVIKKLGMDAPGAAARHDHSLDPIAERCRKIAAEAQQQQQVSAANIMKPCRGELIFPPCADVKLPDIRPRFYVFWGDSKCDCIESDDTEVMTILAYNPHRNVRLCNVTINRIRIVDANGNPPPLLPDGSPSIRLVPIGPYCFGDMPGCTFAWRQFVLRLRGAVAGPYRILLEGICYEICMHLMTEECVTFDVCKD